MDILSKKIKDQMLERIKNSPFFAIQRDETTDFGQLFAAVGVRLFHVRRRRGRRRAYSSTLWKVIQQKLIYLV